MNVLLIGMGMVAQTHVLALRDNGIGARLMGVLGRDSVRTDAFCGAAEETLGHPVATFTSLTGALTQKPDMAIVITPPNARLDIARALVSAGVPTLMEKPVERTLDGARKIVSLYHRNRVPLAVCFQHRTRQAARALKEQLDEGELGDVVHIEMRVPWWRDQHYYDEPGRGTYERDGGGVMINQAIHTLDLGLWLAGPVARVQAMMRTSSLHDMEGEDIAAGLMVFQSGATGVLSASTTTYPGAAESINITTTQAQASLCGDTLRIDWRDGRSKDMRPEGDAATGGGANPMAFTHDWHRSVIEDFVTSVRDNRLPLAPPQEALHVHAVIDAMERAARSGVITEVIP